MQLPHARGTAAARCACIGVLVLGTIVTPAAAADAQTVLPLTGQVTDTAGVPIAAVRVSVASLGRVNVTDDSGSFRFAALAPGTYTVTFSRLGLMPVSVAHVVRPGSGVLRVRMRPAHVQLAATQVTATLSATDARRSPQPTAVLEGPALRVAQGAALGETLELIPGIRSLSMTTGIGKPVIRGMTHYRVVTLDNGQRSETQAWGHDHSPNVETATADRIEVVKGPASVLYGSDALGGVINVIAPEVPDAIDVPAFVRGRLTSAYNHNVRGTDGTVMLHGARGGTGVRAAATVRASGDMRTPRGVLHNTHNEAVALEAAAGHRGRHGSVIVRVSDRGERIEIFDDPVANPGYTGYQRIATRRASVALMLPTPIGRLEVHGGNERNYRREFASVAAATPDLGLLVRNRTAAAHFHHAAIGRFSGTLGASAMRSDFENRGTQRLIPSSGTSSAAVFALESATFGRWSTTAGARWDVRSLTARTADDAASRAERHFEAMTGSLGVLYRVSEPVAIVATIARGFRAPAAPDLYADGFHEGTRAYERGDATLGVETSRNADVGIRVTRADLSAELTGFRNVIRDYIYLRPFGTGPRAFDSLQVVQGDARLSGAEVSVQYRPFGGLTLHASGDYVRGDNTASGIPLTFIPPLRAVYGIRMQRPSTGGAGGRAYLALSAESNARQTRLDPADVGPPGYTLASIHAGTVRILPQGALTLDVAIRNVFDVHYRSFMSRYKEFAAGPGRGVTVKVSTDF